MTLNKTLLVGLLLTFVGTTVQAQTSRREIENLATEMVRQSTYAGQRPTDEALAQMTAVAKDGLAIVCKSHEPDDDRAQRACLRVVQAVVDYAMASANDAARSNVRSGLKKAIDRSDNNTEREQLMTMLVKCATPADAAYFEQYLTDPQTAPLATQALIALPGIDAHIDSLLSATKTPDVQLANIAKARRGEKVVTATPVVARRQVKKDPFWTERLDRDFAVVCSQPDAKADTASTLSSLLQLARSQNAGQRRDAILARYIARVATENHSGAERYLLLREADQLEPGETLRQKIIVDLGDTHSIQALAYLRQYYDSPIYEDATSVAVHRIVRATPEAIGGRHVGNMLNSAKFALARHYDEEGAVEAIDDVLAAIDQCSDAGYELGQTATSLGKKGFWNMHDDMADFALAFDWKTDGQLTVQLRSMPIVTFDREKGVRVAGNGDWHKVDDVDAWRTANIRVERSHISVSVNGHEVCRDALLCNPEPGMPVRSSGYVAFNADDQGAAIRQLCIRKITAH